MKSIRLKIILGILLCSLLTAGIISVLSIRSTMRIAEEDSTENMVNKTAAVANELDSTISRVEQSVNILSDIVLSGLSERRFFSDVNYADAYTSQVLEQVHRFAEHTDGAITAYIRYNPEYTNPTSGCFLTRDSLSDPFSEVVPTDFSMYEPSDLEHVGWYYIPVQHGEPIWMDPYLNSNINVYMISYVVPLYSQDGTSIGIVGMDISFDLLTSMVDSVSLFDSGYGFLTNAAGDIVYHQGEENGKALASLDPSLAGVSAFADSEENRGKTYAYSYKGVDRLMVYQPTKNSMKLFLTAPKSEIYAEAYTLLYTILGAVILALFVCAVVGFFVGNGLAKPIHSLTDIIDQTAKLDLTSSKSGGKLMSQKDEIGQMAAGVHGMRTAFRGMVDSFNDVERAINGSIDNLDSIMKENNARTDDNTDATRNLAQGMAEATENTSQIVRHVGDVRNQMQEINDLAVQSEEESKRIQERAGDMQKRSGTSSDKTHKMYDVMKVKSAEAIEQSKAVERIHELTDDIKSISGQTNLLALNASIEAARAGEAGRGFAVVADEIGSLANQTMKTVDNISGIVEEVGNAVQNMNDCITQLMDFLEETVLTDYRMFQDSGERYLADADYFIDIMSRVRTGTDSLEHYIEEILTAADDINGMTVRSADSVNDIASRSDEMRSANEDGYQKLQDAREAVEELVRITKKFKYNGQESES
ncbi:MAG: methyl-accepting chemotaxis protein [Lachnospiraceae bacterium]|nr:methyl-accepting chemotaxis protein [Lachnospiraceae bacterium]